MEDTQRQNDARERTFSTSLNEARAKFKELTGREMNSDQAALVEQEMRESGYLKGGQLIPGLFFKEIQDAQTQRNNAKRTVKRNLPKNGSRGRSPAPGKSNKRSKEEENDDLWRLHMGSDD